MVGQAEEIIRPQPRLHVFKRYVVHRFAVGKWVADILQHLHAAGPDVYFVRGRMQPTSSLGVRWIGPQATLVPFFERAGVVVVAGGVTLYEAAALGIAAVALAVVPAQRAAVVGFADAGAAVDAQVTLGAGRSFTPRAAARVASLVVELLESPALRRRIGRAGKALVDGKGLARVANALTDLASTDRRAA
jgi:hypothetical protein